MPAPFEMVSGPLEVWFAPEGTSSPQLDLTPPNPWRRMGTNGSRSISDDGITVGFEETIESQRSFGTTGVVKQFRTEEDLMISLSLLDVTVETMALALSGLPVTDVAAASGTPGYRQVETQRGFNVVNLAFLLKGFSPYADFMSAQYWIPKGYASFSGEINYTKGEAAMIEVEIAAIEDLTFRYGLYQGQDAVALP